MKDICVKVYGHLFPTDIAVQQAVDKVLQSWHLNIPHGVDKDLWQIQYEGIYFPTNDVIAAIKPLLSPASQGKLDTIDMDNWKLIRHRFIGTTITCTTTPLNDILAHSEH